MQLSRLLEPELLVLICRELTVEPVGSSLADQVDSGPRAQRMFRHTIVSGSPAGWAAWDDSRNSGLRTNRTSVRLT